MTPNPDTTSPAENDIRPTVASARRPVPTWVIVAVLVLLGLVLFLVLDSRRRALQAPAVKAMAVDLSGGAPLPALYFPPEYAPPRRLARPEPDPIPLPLTVTQPPAPRPAPQPAQPQIVYIPQPAGEPMRPPAPISSSPVLVIDNGGAVRGEPAQASGDQTTGSAENSRAADGQGFGGTARARAGAFANQGTTITQGTLIPAILESALDSTRPGFARAIVSRDVRGFDGTRVLIPRGSRLIGEYGSDNESGQKRALITWTRLIRPDGATVAIDSPVADTMGRTGVRARVNSHFFERFGGAILQSVLDIGTNVASRAIDSPAVIALPGSFSGVPGQRVQSQQVTPTLSVRRGTSISVFVARDLDFTGVEQDRR